MSSSDRNQLQKSLDRASKAASRLGVSDRKARRGTATAVQLNRTLGVNVVSLAAIVGVIWAATIVLDVPINGTGVAVLFAAAVGLSLATNRTGSFSFGFAAISIGLGAVIVDHLVPSAIVGYFDPVTALLLRIPTVPALLSMPSLQLLALAIGTVFVYWALDIRVLTSFYRQSGQPQAANADTVARALADRAESLFEDYVAVAVAFGALGFALLFAVFSGVGDLGSQVLAEAAEVPVLSGSLFNWGVGYVALGGAVPFFEDLPVVGGFFGAVFDAVGAIGPFGFALLAGSVILLTWWSRRNQ